MHIIGIAGGTGSGKTHFSNRLLDYLGRDNACIIQLDSYYKDLSNMKFKDRQKYNFDHPNAIDFISLIDDINKLESFGKVEIPKYNFQTHCRKKNKQVINKKDILIIEGILSFKDVDSELIENMKKEYSIDEDYDMMIREVNYNMKKIIFCNKRFCKNTFTKS